VGLEAGEEDCCSTNNIEAALRLNSLLDHFHIHIEGWLERLRKACCLFLL